MADNILYHLTSVSRAHSSWQHSRHVVLELHHVAGARTCRMTRQTQNAIAAALENVESNLDSRSYATIDTLQALESDTRSKVDQYAELNDAAAGLDTDRQFLEAQREYIPPL